MAKTRRFISEDTTGITTGFAPTADGSGGIVWADAGGGGGGDGSTGSVTGAGIVNFVGLTNRTSGILMLYYIQEVYAQGANNERYSATGSIKINLSSSVASSCCMSMGVVFCSSNTIGTAEINVASLINDNDFVEPWLFRKNGDWIEYGAASKCSNVNFCWAIV